MAQRILGIDIGTYSVKFALLERAFNAFKVLNLLEQPLDLQTRLPHEELVALAVEQAFKAYDFTSDIVSTSFPGHGLSIRIIELPFTNVKKLSEVIEFELEGYVPFDMGDLHYDYHVLGRTETASRLLCVYLKQEKFSAYLEALSRKGADPKYFGADLVDISAVAQVTMVPAEPCYALCDVGHSKTNVCVMKGTELKYSRTIGIGGLHFTRAIQRAFNVNYEKAESLKLSRGRLSVRDEDADQVSRILTHIASELVSGIKQTFLGFDNASGAHHDIAVVYGTGGGSRLSGLLEFFSFHLRTNVIELDALGAVDHEMEESGEANRVMAQAIANAVRPVFSNRLPKINFRKGPFAYKQDIQVFTREMKHVGVLLAFVLLLAAGYYFYADYHYSRKMASIDARVEHLVKAEFPELGAKKGRGLSKLLKDTEAKFKELKTQTAGAFGGGVSVLEVMQEVGGRLPAKKDVKLEFSEFNFAEDYVRINARTDDPLNVTKIVAALKESELFPDIDATDPQSKPNNLWDFTMKIDLKEGRGEQVK